MAEKGSPDQRADRRLQGDQNAVGAGRYPLDDVELDRPGQDGAEQRDQQHAANVVGIGVEDFKADVD